MPTATLIARSSLSYSSSVVVPLVSSSGGGSGGDVSSISISKIMRHGLKEKLLVAEKKSQPSIKTSIRKMKRCSHDGCTNQEQKGGVCMTHGAKVKKCIFEGCTKYAQKGGVCVTHGAKRERKRCSFEGCTNQSKKGGVCWTHGTRLK